MFFFLLYDLVHVPGVRGVPQLDKPYFPGYCALYADIPSPHDHTLLISSL
jgi:hypothetical protein